MDSGCRVIGHCGSIGLTLRANIFSGRIRSGIGGEVRRRRGPGEQLDHRIGDGCVQAELESFSGNIGIRRLD